MELMKKENTVENKADMPNWNRFVKEVLSSRNKGSESKEHENIVQRGQDEVSSKAGAGTDQKDTV